MDLTTRGVGGTDQPIVGSFSPAQNRAILIVGLACASVSLVASLITLRWFILMKRLFRHQLVLFLILSDSFKAFWYFVFPLVVFTRGTVESSSKWCQASGFLLALAVEASDFAILLIALHSVLYVFKPPARLGDGGLYPYRYWIPVVWLLYPLLAASLAFVNPGNAYVTAGTYCYLPQRPFWYRLALAWIPRYVIIIVIIAMYVAVSVYVHVKFRNFKDLGNSEHSIGSLSIHDTSPAGDESPGGKYSPTSTEAASINLELSSDPSKPRSRSYQSPLDTLPKSRPQHQEPWDSVNFITSNTFQTIPEHTGIASADFAHYDLPSSSNAPNTNTVYSPELLSPAEKDRKASEAPTTGTTLTSGTNSLDPIAKLSKKEKADPLVIDPMKRTRLAIRQQLRFLFIYPAVYMLMWAFPFANHCQLYNDHLASHPIFWLQVMTTICLPLQAGIDCLIFSWKEKPWRRIDKESKFSIPLWRRKSVEFVKDIGHGSFGSRHQSAAHANQAIDAEDTVAPLPKRPRTANWWEEEGKKRKDSVWLGTDLMRQITTRQSDGRSSCEDRSASV